MACALWMTIETRCRKNHTRVEVEAEVSPGSSAAGALAQEVVERAVEVAVNLDRQGMKRVAGVQVRVGAAFHGSGKACCKAQPVWPWTARDVVAGGGVGDDHVR